MSNPDPSRLEIRSYRGVFDFERRIYRIDRFVLAPGGVPVRGVLHLLAALALVAVSSSVPLVDALIGAVPWTVRWVALPSGLAVLATAIRLDGRPLHRALPPLLRLVASPRTSARFRPAPKRGARWRPSELVVGLDGSGPWLPAVTYRGPGIIVVRAPHLRSERPARSPRRSAVVRLEAVAAQRTRVKGVAMNIGGGVRVQAASSEDR